MSQKLRFLVDESLEYSFVLHLRQQGHDVISVAEDLPSMEDKEILNKAYKQKRIIITNDKDFGDLIFLQKLSHAGIILLRFRLENAKTKVKLFESVLKKYSTSFSNKFTVIDEGKIRIRSV